MTDEDRIRRPHLRVEEDRRHSEGAADDGVLNRWMASIVSRRQGVREQRAARAQLRSSVRRRRARERSDLWNAAQADRFAPAPRAHAQSASGGGEALGRQSTRTSASVADLFRGVRVGRFLIIGLAVVVAVTIGLIFSPWLSVQHIVVQGAERSSADDLSEALADQVGRPIIGLSGAQIDRELQPFSAIESYNIRAELPGTLIVTVTERTPIGVFQKDGSYLLVDAAGVVLLTADRQEEGYPLLQVGSTDPQSPAFASVAQVLHSLNPVLLGQIASAQASTQDDVQLTMRSGTTVLWGDGGENALKARVLAALVKDRPDATHIDVSSPSLPVVS